MKKSRVILACVLAVALVLFISANSFSGFGTNWFKANITEAELICLFSDASAGKSALNGDGKVIVGELASFCATGYDWSKIKADKNTYPDLQNNKNAAAVLKMMGLGYLSGKNNGTIGVNDVVSRERALVIYARIHNLRFAQTGYGDPSTGASAYAKGYIEPLLVAGVLLQDEQGNLNIKNTKTTSKGNSYTSNITYVTDEMDTADYWAKLCDDPNALIMTAAEIESLNKKILSVKATYTNDLDALPATVDGKALAIGWASFKTPDYPTYRDGKQMREADYQAIRNNILNARTYSDQQVLYGICVSHTDMRSIPSDRMITDDLNDPEYDDFMESAVLVNEPMVIDGTTADKKFYHVITYCCSGWVSAEDVARCESKEEWQEAKDYDQRLVVTGQKVYLEANALSPDLSQKLLTMGTTLELVTGADRPEKLDNRATYGNYVVKMPAKNSDGSYSCKLAMIPVNRDVYIGYLPMSTDNVLRQFFKCVGDRYGWGGLLGSMDCSSMIREVYLCFGLQLPRNSNWQTEIPAQTVSLTEDMTEAQRMQVFDMLNAGDLVKMPGHITVYLGKSEGRYYVISALGFVVEPLEDSSATTRVRGIVVNDLSVKRASGITWFNSIDKVVKF